MALWVRYLHCMFEVRGPNPPAVTGISMNNDKCHLLFTGYKHEVIWANIGKESNMGKQGTKTSWRYY